MDLQDVFNRVMVIDNERDLASGGDEVANGLIAADMVVDIIEMEAAQIEGVLTTHDLLYTAENTETSDWPEHLLRLDALWYVDADTNRPVWEITTCQGIGNHVPGFTWPLSEMVLSGSSSNVAGKVKEYVASGPGGQFYWVPIPDAEYWVRAYGLWKQPDFEDATSPFPFPPAIRTPFVYVLDKLLKTGLDRDLSVVVGEGTAALRKALKGLAKFQHTMPSSRVYSEVHDA